jgi:hypothetical protein
VTESEGGSAYGRTHWRRFALAAGIPAIAVVGLGAGMANGAVGASFTVSGEAFKISADRLEGDGFTQYGGKVEKKDGTEIPVAISGIGDARLYNLCQSVYSKGSPVSITIRAGREDGHPATAKNLLIGMTELSGDATFTGINIGQDASTLKKGGPDAHGDSGGFGQEADKVKIDGLHQTSLSTTAGTFALTGLELKVNFPGDDGKPVECF